MQGGARAPLTLRSVNYMVNHICEPIRKMTTCIFRIRQFNARWGQSTAYAQKRQLYGQPYMRTDPEDDDMYLQDQAVQCKVGPEHRLRSEASTIWSTIYANRSGR